MAKEIALGKRAKISKAQQYMLLAVLGTAIIFGASFSFVVHFIQQISFNSDVIAEEEKSIANYSSIIKNTGVCKAPSGTIYSSEELSRCEPDSIQISEIPGTLRAKILQDVAANDALNSVPKEDDSSCINPATGSNYTYQELNKKYREASGSEELRAASQLIKSCSALRVIPDALPSFKNEEALLASVNKLFNISGWTPENLSPAGSSSSSDLGINTISVNLPFSSDPGTTMTILDNIERSIREFNIERATISWANDSTLSVSAQATAYYIDKSTLTESTKTMNVGDKKK